MTTKFPELAASSPPAPFKFANLVHSPATAINTGYFEVPELLRALRKFGALQLAHATRDTAERIAVIAGPPGVGKSNGARVILLACGFHVAVISCSMFASEVEGGATATLNAMLEEFARYSTVHRARMVVVFDDFDLSIVARDEKTGVSSNTNLLTERMQYLADNRHIYRNYDGTNIGFVFTINNAEAIRSSLLRDMRAMWIEHDPDKPTKANIAYRILDPQTAGERTFVDKLIRRYANQPIAFWKALRLDMDSARLEDVLSNGMPSIDVLDAAMAQRAPFNLTLLGDCARKRAKSRIRNYLFSRS